MIKKNQKGFTLMELIFVMVIIGLMMMLEMSKKQAEFEQMQARTLGVEIYQVANAVSRYTAYYSGDSDFTPEDEYTDLDFLKDADDDGIDGCADNDSSTPTTSFLICDFLTDNKTTFGDLGFTITIEQTTSTNSTTGAETTYLTSKIVFDTLSLTTSSGTYEAKSLSGLAALVAAGATTVGSSDPSLLSTVATIGYCLTDSISYCDSDDVGHIVAITSDDPSTQTWLRIDHGNTMQNILEFGSDVTDVDSNGYSLRQIMSVARIYNGEDAGGSNSALILGNAGEVYSSDTINPILSGAGVVVDADMIVYKELAVLSDVSIEGNLTVDYDANIGGDASIDGDLEVRSDALVKGDFTTEGDSDLQSNADVGGDLSVSGNVVINGTLTVDLATQLNSTLTVEDDVFAPIIYDNDDLNYYVDPGATSNLESLIVDVNAELPEDTYITINGTKRLLANLLPTYVHMFSAEVGDGDTVTKPTCETGGDEKIILTPIVTPVRAEISDDSSYYAAGAIYSYTTDSGTYWTVSIGTSPSDNNSNASAVYLANAYCSYEIR